MVDRPLPPVQPLLKSTLPFDPAADVESWRLSIPAKPACYLLCDEHEQPILLATTGNLRTALLNRLAGGLPGVSPRDDDDDDSPNDIASSPRTDYRAITRIIRYRPCCSAFEAEWTFIENVRTAFPRRYRTMLRPWRAHWITCDPQAAHPRFTVETHLNFRGFGPIPTLTAAQQTVEALIDLCDLCRYHDILIQAPRGIACAYKEMGKCPAPCDGSISMDAYRQQIDDALALLAGRRDRWIAAVQQHMKQAAAELKFELAARWKLKLDRLAALDHPSLHWCKPLDQWRGVYLQPGSGKNALRPFIVTPGDIRFIGEITARQREDQLAFFQSHLPALLDQPARHDDLAAARMALLIRHLFKDSAPGRWVAADQPLDVAPIPSP